MLYLITGLPGTGKSAVNAELKRRGYESYDGDEDNLAQWLDNKGQPLNDCEASEEFARSHIRGVTRKKVRELAEMARGKMVFLCNDPENEDDIRDMFDKIFALVLDEDSRLKRLTNRTNNSWGKQSWHLERDLVFVERAQVVYKKYGYRELDATLPVETITDMIIAQCS